MSKAATKMGYCRVKQNPFQGCAASQYRKLARIAIHNTTVGWLCKACCKKYDIPWPEDAGK